MLGKRQVCVYKLSRLTWNSLFIGCWTSTCPALAQRVSTTTLRSIQQCRWPSVWRPSLRLSFPNRTHTVSLTRTHTHRFSLSLPLAHLLTRSLLPLSLTFISPPSPPPTHSRFCLPLEPRVTFGAASVRPATTASPISVHVIHTLYRLVLSLYYPVLAPSLFRLCLYFNFLAIAVAIACFI